MKNCFHRVLSASILFAAALSAQTVTVRGELGDGRATGCYYCPGSRYVVKWTETQIDSSTINLALYLNQQLQLTGTFNGTLARPSIDVTAVQVVTETYSFSGQSRIGSRLRPSTHAAAGDLAFNLIALDAGFASAGGSMTVLMDPATTMVLGFGVCDNNGEFRSNADIPNVPALVGQRVFGQSMIVPIAGGLPFGSNPDVAIVQP